VVHILNLIRRGCGFRYDHADARPLRWIQPSFASSFAGTLPRLHGSWPARSRCTFTPSPSPARGIRRKNNDEANMTLYSCLPGECPAIAFSVYVRLNRRNPGTRCVIGACVICPCHLPLTLRSLPPARWHGGLGAALPRHPYVAGLSSVVMAVRHLAGFRSHRRTRTLERRHIGNRYGYRALMWRLLHWPPADCYATRRVPHHQCVRVSGMSEYSERMKGEHDAGCARSKSFN